MISPQGGIGPDLSGLNNLNLFGGPWGAPPPPPKDEIPEVKLERLGAQEEQAQRQKIARDLAIEQQSAMRKLASQQAKLGMRSGAAASQRAQLAQRVGQQLAEQEQQGGLQRSLFNLQQQQKEQFANVAKQLALKQIAASLEGQKLMAEAAKEGARAQVQAAKESQQSQGLLSSLFGWLF